MRYLRPAIIALLALAAAVLGMSLVGLGGISEVVGRGTSETSIGVDVDPENTPANTASSLGSRESCRNVAVGEAFEIDVVIINVQNLLAWFVTFLYDGSLLTLTDVDVQQFQAAQPGSVVVNLSPDSLPDSDGISVIAASDIADGASDSGTGVLARLTLQATDPGISHLSLFKFTAADSDGTPIGDTDGDGIFDGSLLNGSVGVETPCVLVEPPPIPTPTTTPTPTPVPCPLAQPPLGETSLGIDAEPSGNSATCISLVNPCRNVAVGEAFEIDVVIINVQNLLAWFVTFLYDGSLLTLTDVDVQQFQAAQPGSVVVNLSPDSLPDSDGISVIAASDIADGASDSGTGVLARLTLQATDPGISHLSLFKFTAADSDGTPIGDTDGDGIFDGTIFGAEIRVDGDACPPPDDDGDGVGDGLENGAPNGGDGDNDGAPDRLQANVTSLPNAVDGRYITLVSPPATTHGNVRAVGNPSPGNAPPGVSFPVGFFEFEVQGLTPGGSTTTTLLLPSGVTINTYYKFGPEPGDASDHWYEYLFDGTTGAQISGNTVTLHFVDGQRGDHDLAANGTIVEPGGPGGAAAAVGGVLEVLVDPTDSSPSETSDRGLPALSAVAVVGGFAAGVIALAAGGWYIRRRWQR